MSIRAIYLLPIFLISSFVHAKEYFIQDEIKTDVGLVQTLREVLDEGHTPPQYLGLDGKIIYEETSSSNYLHIIGSFRTGDYVAILFSKSCGGSGCRIDPLSFLLFDKNKNYSIVTDANFNSDSMVINPKERDGLVEVDLGFEKQKIKKAILKGNILKIEYSDIDITKMNDENCLQLYKVSEACVRLHKSELDCTEDAKDYFPGSNYEMWVVHVLRNYPGFNSEAFNHECFNACKTGALSEYKLYKNNVCNKLSQ